MKKLLFSAALVATCLGSAKAQITLNDIAIPTITGGTVVPLFQGVTGNYQVQGQLLPRVTGTFNAASIDAILTASTLDTYANDLAILVTSTSNVATADILLQVGGYSNFSTNKIPWPCTACDTSTIGTPLVASANFAGINFSTTEYVIWMANGYANANPGTNTGAWTVNSVTFGGISFGSASVESNVPMTAVAYPNPATDVLNVVVEGVEVVAVSVISVDGKVISTNDGSIVQVADLTAGVYFYEARTAAGAVLRNSFVKK